MEKTAALDHLEPVRAQQDLEQKLQPDDAPLWTQQKENQTVHHRARALEATILVGIKRRNKKNYSFVKYYLLMILYIKGAL